MIINKKSGHINNTPFLIVYCYILLLANMQSGQILTTYFFTLKYVDIDNN